MHSFRLHRSGLSAVLGLLTMMTSAMAKDSVELLVVHGTIVVMDPQRTVIEDGALAVQGGKILSVGKSADLLERFEAARTVDAKQAVVMPGLINAHGHAAMTLFRGLADDKALMDWLRNYIFPAEAKFVDEPFVRAGTRLGILEMLLGGTTTYVDMYYFEDAVADETAKAGMRGVIGQAMIDFPAPDHKTWDATLAGTEAFLKKWQGHRLITAAPAPHAPYTVSPEHLQAAKQLADKYSAPLIIHLAETQDEVENSKKQYQATPTVHLDRIGFLGPNVIAKHVVWADEDELLLLKKHGVGIAHCPQSNMKLASGIAPVPQMLKLGLGIGLGTDGAASNNDLDMWGEIGTVAMLHKVDLRDPTVVNAHEAVAMATIDGARAIHLEDKIGSLEVGKEADFIIVDVTAPHVVPMYDVFSHLAYAVKASDVRTVAVAGRIVVEDRKPTTLDAEQILSEAREYRDRIRTLLAK
ncbi:MAG: amidohydrolase family protein [Pirellulales bacterium]